MFRFLKENSYLIFKLMLNQIAMTVFGLVLTVATNQNDMLCMLTSLFSIAFYMFLLASMLWEEGAKDKIRSDAGRLHPQPLRGLFLAIPANIINFILGVLVVIGFFCSSHYINEAGKLVVESPLWAANMYGISRAIAWFIQAMYAGLVQYYSPFNPVAYILIVLPALVVCWAAYYAGLRGLGFKKKNKAK